MSWRIRKLWSDQVRIVQRGRLRRVRDKGDWGLLVTGDVRQAAARLADHVSLAVLSGEKGGFVSAKVFEEVLAILVTAWRLNMKGLELSKRDYAELMTRRARSTACAAFAWLVRLDVVKHAQRTAPALWAGRGIKKACRTSRIWLSAAGQHLLGLDALGVIQRRAERALRRRAQRERREAGEAARRELERQRELRIRLPDPGGEDYGRACAAAILEGLPA